MTLPVRLTAAAEQDLRLATGWYMQEAPNMLAPFEEEIERSFRRIAERPEMYQVVEATVRRATLRRFPISVFCRVLPDWIEVIGILQQSRNPRSWRRRM